MVWAKGIVQLFYNEREIHLFMSLPRADEKVDSFLKLPSDDKKSAPYSLRRASCRHLQKQSALEVYVIKKFAIGIYCC